MGMGANGNRNSPSRTPLVQGVDVRVRRFVGVQGSACRPSVVVHAATCFDDGLHGQRHWLLPGFKAVVTIQRNARNAYAYFFTQATQAT